MYNPGRIMLGNLRALFGVLIDIALLRRGPDSLPTSTVLMAVVIALYIVLSAILTSLIPTAPRLLPLQIAVGTLVTLLCFDLAFRATRKRERFVQTMTGVFGVNAVFLPALLPMELSLLPFIEKPDPANPPPYALFVLTLFVEIWLIVVQVRIVRAAFEWPYFASIAFFFGERLAGVVIFMLLFGAPPKAA